MEPLDNLHHWRMTPDRAGYSYILDAESVAYFHLPDPGDPFGTVSPLQSQAAAIDADDQLQLSQARAFQNGIFPGMVIKVGRPFGGDSGERLTLTKAMRQQLIEGILAWNGGPKFAGAPLIVDGLIEEATPATTAPREMDFLDSGSQLKSRIMQAFGVNPLIVGEIQGAAAHKRPLLRSHSATTLSTRLARSLAKC